MPEREAARRVGVPEIAGARTVQRPPREVADGRGHRPDREPPDVLADEGDRAGEGERKRDRAEDEDPDPALAEAEDAVGEGVRRGRDDDQLEGRPAQVLHDVEHRRCVRAALPERLPHEHHPREAALGADVASEAEEGAAEGGADDDREQTPLEAQAGEVRAGDQDEQADAEVPPEQGEVAEGERAQPVGNRCDAPCPLVLHALPSLALPRSGSRVRALGPLSAAVRLPGRYAGESTRPRSSRCRPRPARAPRRRRGTPRRSRPRVPARRGSRSRPLRSARSGSGSRA